jgi:hypothetical protein
MYHYTHLKLAFGRNMKWYSEHPINKLRTKAVIYLLILLDKPPSILSHHDLDALIISKYDDIILRLGTLHSTNLLYPDRKQLPSNILQRLQEVQSKLLLFQDIDILKVDKGNAS